MDNDNEEKIVNNKATRQQLLKGTGVRVYGNGDDSVYLSGEYHGEYSDYDATEHGIIVFFSDGTLVIFKYGKLDMAIWGIELVKKGLLFDKIEYCTDDDADIYSDILYLKSGIKWAIGGSKWAKIK